MRKIRPLPPAAAGQLCNFLNLVASPPASPPTATPPLVFSASPFLPSRSLVPALLKDNDC